MTDTPNPRLDEILASALDDEIPDVLIPLVEAWIPLELDAVGQGLGPLATEILSDARYAALGNAIAKLRADVVNSLEIRTSGEPHDGDYLDEVRSRTLTQIEAESLEAATPRLRDLLAHAETILADEHGPRVVEDTIDPTTVDVHRLRDALDLPPTPTAVAEEILETHEAVKAETPLDPRSDGDPGETIP